MKTLTLSLLLALVFSFHANSQDLKKQLLDKTWYVTGRLYSKKPMMLASDPKSNFNWATKFLPSGKVFIEETIKDESFDAEGKSLGYGHHYIDSTYKYEFIKDRIKIDYSDVISEGEQKRCDKNFLL